MSTKIAVIGCGKQAAKHISGLRRIDGVELVLADKDPALARALGAKEGLPWVDAVDAVFADGSVAAIDVCTPTGTHGALIGRALDGGKDFFCEKPLCETAEEARAIRAYADRAGRIGMVGYIYRFAPVFELFRDILSGARESGRSVVLGELATATIRIGGRGSHALWKHRKATNGGAINEMLVHMLDLATWYFGRVRRAEILARDLLRPRRMIDGRLAEADAEDFVLVRCDTEAGFPVFLQADLVTPAFTQSFEVQGDNGTLVGSIQPEMPQFVFVIEPAGSFKAGRTDLAVAPANMFESQMAAWVEAIRTRTPPDRCTLEDSVRVIEAVEMLRVSADHRAAAT